MLVHHVRVIDVDISRDIIAGIVIDEDSFTGNTVSVPASFFYKNESPFINLKIIGIIEAVRLISRRGKNEFYFIGFFIGNEDSRALLIQNVAEST